VDTQQLLWIIVIAIAANAALITIALVSMRRSHERGMSMESELDAAADSIPAIVMAAAAGSGTTTAHFTSGPEGAQPAFGDLSTNGATPDDQMTDEMSEPDVDLLDLPVNLESPVDWRRSVEDEVVRLTRYHRPATVMLVELDGFERLTDRLGEAAGTRLLVATARTLQAQSRGADRSTQLRRGRFGILLPETDEISAINFAERVRAECDRWLEAGEVALRLAIGWTILDATQGATPAIEEAERRLNAERRQRTGSTA